jgi:alpha-mannosidase
MPPKLNPLPELIPNRIVMLRNLLRASIWEGHADVPVEISPILDAPLPVAQAPALSYAPIAPGAYFGRPFGDWQQCWFKVTVPAAQPDQEGRRYFFWDVRGETTAYLDGQPYAGLDVAHPFFKLPDRACTLYLDCATYQTCIWYPGSKPVDRYGLRFEGAWISSRDLKLWETYWDLHILVEYLSFLLKRDGLGDMVRPWGPYPAPQKAHPIVRKLLARFDEVWLAWEKGGFEAIAPLLKAIFAAFPAETWQPKMTMIGHSHLDLVWMWPEEEGERKAIHTIATALRWLDEYPQYRFMWTSPHTMQQVEERFPAVYAQIQNYLRAGRWEATGGAWVEFDTLIACGEALGRSLVLGQNRFVQLRGEISDTVWLPDCFGFNGFLPQIMRLAGIQNFYTTKLSWNSQTHVPYDSFLWRSSDGSQVLTHLDCTAPDHEPLANLVGMAELYRETAVNNELLKSIGIGDGGGGTTYDQIEMINRLGSLAQIPATTWGSVEDFFDRLGQSAEKLPVYEGELYLEFHRGIYTTQSEFKRRYRGLERALQTWESARVLAGGGSIPDSYWERLFFTQFHDALPGSSIKLVYDQLGANLEALAAQAMQQAAADAARALIQQLGAGEQWAVFNPLAIDRQVVVELPAPVPGAALQKAGEKWLAALSVPGLSVAAVTAGIPPAWEVTPRVLDNGLLRVEFDEQGQIRRVCDRGGGTCSEWPLAGTPQFILHPDLPPTFDAWEIDHIATRQNVKTISALALRVAESGPVRAVLSGKVDLSAASQMEVRYILEANRPALQVELNLDWQEDHRLLRFYLPTQLRGRMARYGAPFGAVERPQVPGGPREEAMWEVPGSRWAAVLNDPGTDGLAIVTEAKYGFACRDGELALTLLRAPADPGEPDQPQRLRPQHSPDCGPHTLRFAVSRYTPAGSAGHLSTAALAETLYAPTLLAQVESVAAHRPPFRFSGDLRGLVPSWVLPARTGPGYILRLHETLGESGTLELAFAEPVQVQMVDLLERAIEKSTLEQPEPSAVKLGYGPYQVISLYVK